MKLLYCLNCHTFISLDDNYQCCPCGKTLGWYGEDGNTAYYTGEYAIPIGFNNHSFNLAISNQENKGKSPRGTYGWEFESFIYERDSEDRKSVV